jgi:SNF2 family DNA or RNA helicase
MNKAFAEINHSGDRVEVHFRYDFDTYRSVKEVPGARFVGQGQGGPFWLLPLGLDTMRRLREELGTNLVLGRALKDWGKEAVKREENLHKLATTDNVPLKDLVIAKKLPELAKWFRPYQRADVKFLATTSCLNLNEQRLGKTTEVIGAVYEAGLENGQHLVCAPKTSLETVWRFEIERWTEKLEKPPEVITYSGELSTLAREAAIDEFWACVEEDWPVWFVCNPDTIRDGKEPNVEKWASFTIDEYHRSGLSNAVGGKDKTKGSKFSWAVKEIDAERRYAMSGTPMGGKPIKLWGGLHFLYPKQFTSKWTWARHWLEVSDSGHGQDVGSILRGREDEFYKSLAPYAIRRLRSEVLPQLPAAQWIDVWCDMTAKQAKQYQAMAQLAEVNIEEKQLNALGILAEYTRLKQFADAYAGEIVDHTVNCDVCRGQGEIEQEYGGPTKCLKCDGLGKITKQSIIPSEESGKLPHLMDRLAENGIDPKDPEGTSVAVFASQFSSIVDMVHGYLNKSGIVAEKITGAVKQDDRTRIQMAFRDDGKPTDARVLCMTTTAGGVAITLDRCDHVHIFDETWVPDDQEQLADRTVNTSRMHQVGVYVYRSRNTVESHIQEVNVDKSAINREILDLRRQGFRATMQDKEREEALTS